VWCSSKNQDGSRAGQHTSALLSLAALRAEDPQLSYAWSARKVLVAAWELWMLSYPYKRKLHPLLAGKDSFAVMAAVRVTSHGHTFSTIACTLDVSAAPQELRRRVEYRAEESLGEGRGSWKTPGSLTSWFAVFVNMRCCWPYSLYIVLKTDMAGLCLSSSAKAVTTGLTSLLFPPQNLRRWRPSTNSCLHAFLASLARCFVVEADTALPSWCSLNTWPQVDRSTALSREHDGRSHPSKRAPAKRALF
jgi:hypothetical protein